jgi:imidazolonepropionase-like amidohydrolase
MVEFGMSPMQAIQAATLKAAALLGLENQVGTLNEGAYADLIAVQGNPLENVSLLENIGFVMKDGEVFLNQFSN